MISYLKKTIASLSKVKQNQHLTKDLLEEMLLEADVSYDVVEEILYYLPPSDKVNKEDLRRVMSSYFMYDKKDIKEAKPFVELILGVNGAGKTTTVAKLANLYKKQNFKVLLGACDTFRAGATKQLKLWADKLNIDIVANEQSNDPSAIAYDSIQKALSKSYDRVLLDTAGRLQNQKNLNQELEKIIRVSNKALEGAPHRKILVLDGTQGNTALEQARVFNELVSLDGLIITKLDGTAKGGVLLSIARELELNILYIGLGEAKDDIVSFNYNAYVNSLVDGIYGE